MTPNLLGIRITAAPSLCSIIHSRTGRTSSRFENETYASYIEAFRACKRLHTHPEDFYNDPEGEGPDSDSDSGDEDPQEEDDSPLADLGLVHGVGVHIAIYDAYS
jgi:hypothetical protein